MSVRNSLLALLDSQPMYGAQLKAEFHDLIRALAHKDASNLS